ncbi:hypothetical protein RND81_08G162700 [Saponaria officinalis]
MLLRKHSPNVTHQGRTLLHHAILCANLGAVNVLLDSGVDIEFPVKTSKTMFRPLHMAARLGLHTILRSLVDAGCDINSRTNFGDTALMICAKYKHDECLKVLTEAGADFGLVNSGGFSVYTIACSNKWSSVFQQTVLQVIKAGKIPQSSNTANFSPVLFAAQAGDVEALKTVIAQPGINLNQADDIGFTPVLLTALKGHVECFRSLVYAKADVKVYTKSGDTVMSLAELSHKRDLFEKVLLEYALEMDSFDADGFYALHCAARKGDLIAARLLISKGYDVNTPDGDGYTPLMSAAREGHATVCKFLISQGACCDFKNSRGETAILLARSNTMKGRDAEYVILDELARKLALKGAWVMKHTRCGKGSPHAKMIQMEEIDGNWILRWGKSSRKNVVCKKAEVGPSENFRKNKRGKGDADEGGVFHVVTSKNKEVHFVSEGGCDAAKLWVRGIKLLTKDTF